jgi:hypothetical protein
MKQLILRSSRGSLAGAPARIATVVIVACAAVVLPFLATIALAEPSIFDDDYKPPPARPEAPPPPEPIAGKAGNSSADARRSRNRSADRAAGHARPSCRPRRRGGGRRRESDSRRLQG